jgi:hypothetical protein
MTWLLAAYVAWFVDMRHENIVLEFQLCWVYLKESVGSSFSLLYKVQSTKKITAEVKALKRSLKIPVNWNSCGNIKAMEKIIFLNILKQK